MINPCGRVCPIVSRHHNGLLLRLLAQVENGSDRAMARGEPVAAAADVMERQFLFSLRTRLCLRAKRSARALVTHAAALRARLFAQEARAPSLQEKGAKADRTASFGSTLFSLRVLIVSVTKRHSFSRPLSSLLFGTPAADFV